MHWEGTFFPLPEELRCRPGASITATVAQVTHTDPPEPATPDPATAPSPLPGDRLRMWYEWQVSTTEAPGNTRVLNAGGSVHSILLGAPPYSRVGGLDVGATEAHEGSGEREAAGGGASQGGALGLAALQQNAERWRVRNGT